MPRYLNTSGATLTFQGVTFRPGDIHDVPNPIYSRIMYPTNLPCTKIPDELVESTSDELMVDGDDVTLTDSVSDSKFVDSGKSKTKPKTSVKEEKDGTNNNK